MYTCKTCTTDFKKKLTLKEKHDKIKPCFCSQKCAEAYSRVKEIKETKKRKKRGLPKSSKEEKSFGDVIKSFFPLLESQWTMKDYDHHYDFYSPELNLIIEYNGLYWHNMPKNRIKDRRHLLEATRNKVYMAVVTDEEWKIFIGSGLPDKSKLIRLLNRCTKNMIN